MFWIRSLRFGCKSSHLESPNQNSSSYRIVGDQAPLKSADFASAVIFAQEYGILAASLQDRPFIPKSFVSLGGPPARCQSAFRKWAPRSLHAPCVFPLNVAIEALRSPEGKE